MFVAGVNAGIVPLRVASIDHDPVHKAEHGARERSLLLLAATRARDLLVITSSG